jgi:hypothetical protein
MKTIEISRLIFDKILVMYGIHFLVSSRDRESSVETRERRDNRPTDASDSTSSAPAAKAPNRRRQPPRHVATAALDHDELTLGEVHV